jgi:hypothetical protein
MSARLASAAVFAATVIVTACGDLSPSAPTAPSASTTIAANRSADRTGALHVTKNCSTYLGGAGEFCTITATNLAAIQGARIVYTTKADGAALDTDVTLVAPGPGDNRAFGHCTVDLATGAGKCRLTGGTGTLAGLEAKVEVSYVGGEDGFDFGWDGRYHFTGQQGND